MPQGPWAWVLLGPAQVQTAAWHDSSWEGRTWSLGMPMAPGEALWHPRTLVTWRMGLQEVWRMAQVGASGDLSVHVQVRNDDCRTSIDKANIFAHK